jgi:hypothetical protein
MSTGTNGKVANVLERTLTRAALVNVFSCRVLKNSEEVCKEAE